MGRPNDPDATAEAARFAHAAAAFASEAVLAVSRLGKDAVPSRAANEALVAAAQAAEDLERLARKAPAPAPAEAYRLATTALHAAAVALGEMKPRPWIHHVRPARDAKA